jgi:hypothetical protein
MMTILIQWYRNRKIKKYDEYSYFGADSATKKNTGGGCGCA